jgi:predicted permease
MTSSFRYGLRALAKAPGFTLVAILTIAIGIGANTALFSTFNTLVLHPMSLPKSDELVRIWANNSTLGFNAPALSWPRYEFFRDHQKSFSSISAAAFTGYALTRNGAEPEQLNSLQVSVSFFPTLGVSLLRGRNFTKEEDTAGGPNVVILSHECWQTRFGGRETLLGEVITLNSQSFTVVGITPPALGNPFSTVLAFTPRVFESNGLTAAQVQNGAGYIGVTARLRPGVSLAQASAEVKALAENYKASYATRLDGKNDSTVRTFAEELVGNLKPTFYMLLAAVGFVLLIACANVASLFLGRLSARHKEIAVRLSMGATRGQLVQQFLAESVIFSALAGVLGLAIGWGSLIAIQRLSTNQLPAGVTLKLDLTALLFTVFISALSAVFIGLIPALNASRTDVAEVLKDTARSAAGGTRGARFRSVLIVGEVVLSVVLLVSSSLLLVSFVRLQRTPPGFEPKGVATAFLSIAGPRYPTGPQQADFFARYVERLESQPQVKSAAVAIGVPLSGFQPRSPYAIGGRPVPPLPERPLAQLDIVSEHYFSAMGIPLRAGRAFTPQDNDKAPTVCILSESFARRLFPGESALGKILLRGRDAEIKCEIVGIAADVKSNGLNAPAPDDMYFPFRQLSRPVGTLIVRSEGDPALLQSVLRSDLAALDATIPVTLFSTMEASVAQSLGFQRITAWLTGIFAGVALLLSVVGLYSVLAYAVTQRTSEIGIRMALGAQRSQVVGLVLRSGLRLVALGLVLGLGLAALVTQFIATLLYNVQPLDPAIYAGVAGLFAVIATLACLLPSLRASRIDPLVALRTD